MSNSLRENKCAPDRCNPAASRVSFSGHRARHILDGALEDEDDLVRTVSNSEYSEYSEASGGRVSSTQPH